MCFEWGEDSWAPERPPDFGFNWLFEPWTEPFKLGWVSFSAKSVQCPILLIPVFHCSSLFGRRFFQVFVVLRDPREQRSMLRALLRHLEGLQPKELLEEFRSPTGERVTHRADAGNTGECQESDLFCGGGVGVSSRSEGFCMTPWDDIFGKWSRLVQKNHGFNRTCAKMGGELECSPRVFSGTF